MKERLFLSFLSCLSFFFIVMSCQKNPLASYNANSMPQTHLPFLNEFALEPLGITNLQANVNSSSVYLFWDEALGAKTYIVQRSEVSGGPYTLLQNDLTSPNCLDTDISPNTSYFYIVSAINPIGETPPSSELHALPLGGSVNLTLQKLIANPTGNLFNASFTWSSSVSAANLYSFKNTTNSNSIITTCSSSPCVVNSLQPSSYVLEASSTLPEAISNVVDSSALIIPSFNLNVQAVASSQGALTVSWTPQAGLSSYNIYYATSSFLGSDATNLGTLGCSGSSSCTIYGIGSLVNYTIVMVANLTEGGTYQSSESYVTSLQITTASNTPSVTPTSSNTPSQTPTASQTGSQTSSSTNTPSNTPSSTATSSQTASQTSTPSQTASSTNIPSVPTGLSVGTVTSTSVNLSWNASSGASSYNIKWSTTPGGPYTTIGSSASPSYSVNTSSVQGTIYYYVVTAVNPSGQSAYSNQVGAISLASTQGLTLNSAITNAAATSQTLSFSWTGVTGSNSYTLYQSTTSGQELISGTAVCTTSSTSCSTATTLGSAYYYVLVASNSTVSSNTVSSSEVTMPNVTSVNPTLTAVSSTQAILDFVPTANLQTPYSVYYYTSSFNGGNATTTGGATQACTYNSSPSSTPAVSPTPTSTPTGTGTGTKNISPSGTPTQTPTSSNTPSPTVNAGSYSCPVIDTSDQMLYFVVVGTLANGATYQSEEASVPLIGNFSITSITPNGYSTTYGNRTIQINFPVTSVGGTTYTVAYKLATDVNYTSVPGSFSSSPITLDYSSSVTGLNLYPNAMYMFQVTAANNTGTRANTVSVTSNAPQYYKIPPTLAVSNYTSYYLNSQGNLYGWGSNAIGLLLSASSNQNSPIALTTTNDGLMVASGVWLGAWGAMCLLKNTFQPYCVGFNNYGTVGRGLPLGVIYSSFSNVLAKSTVNISPSGTPTPSGSKASSLSSTPTPSPTLSASDTPSTVTNLTNIVSIAVGRSSACGLDNSQKMWCWGSNADGQLQGPDSSIQPWASKVLDNANYLTAGGVGEYYSCSIRTDNSVWCWGNGSITANQVKDAAGNPITDFMDLSVGFNHNCGIRSDGSVWCWGSGSYFIESWSLGSSTITTSAAAIPAATFTTNDALSITSGFYFTCVVRKNGELVCWGNNQYGQLGLPMSTLEASSSAYQIQNWTDVRSVVSNSDAFHVCAIRQDAGVDSVWCWGSNIYGELGAGNTPTPGFTTSVSPSVTNSFTGTGTVTPTATSAVGSATSTSTLYPSATSTPATSFSPGNYQYTPQYVSVPVM
jgi:alpha-tubulin suppressor-like RCC1 family protein/fibronectin type 3 domain-containing protein